MGLQRLQVLIEPTFHVAGTEKDTLLRHEPLVEPPAVLLEHEPVTRPVQLLESVFASAVTIVFVDIDEIGAAAAPEPLE
jgi:hypothetical protein